MPNLSFKTSVSGEVDGEFYIRGYKHDQLIEEASFPQTLYLSLTGSLPSKEQEAMINALLVASIDHGVSPSSGFVPRVVVANGNDVTHSMAAGLLALGPYHGGAINDACALFHSIHQDGTDLNELVTSYREQKKKFMGYGHRVYTTSDPRTVQLFTKADKLGLSSTYRTISLELQDSIEKIHNKRFVLNVDGAFAAILLDLGLPPKAGNGLFAMARVGGMIAHILEEYQESSPVRRLDADQVEYTFL